MVSKYRQNFCAKHFQQNPHNAYRISSIRRHLQIVAAIASSIYIVAAFSNYSPLATPVNGVHVHAVNGATVGEHACED